MRSGFNSRQGVHDLKFLTCRSFTLLGFQQEHVYSQHKFLLTFCFALLCFALGLSVYSYIIQSSIIHAMDNITSISVARCTVDELKMTWARASAGTVHTTSLVKQMP